MGKLFLAQRVMGWVMGRAREGSTQAGIGVLIAVLFGLDPNAATHIDQIALAVSGLLAVVLKDKPAVEGEGG